MRMGLKKSRPSVKAEGEELSKSSIAFLNLYVLCLEQSLDNEKNDQQNEARI